jgi:hypothetical protein
MRLYEKCGEQIDVEANPCFCDGVIGGYGYTKE